MDENELESPHIIYPYIRKRVVSRISLIRVKVRVRDCVAVRHFKSKRPHFFD